MANPLRFSLAALIGAIVLVSLYLAALRESSSWSAEAALTLSIGLLLGGLLWAVFHPGANRLFWIGFQLCGWGYLLLAFSDWSQAQLGTRLPTTRLAEMLHGSMPIMHNQEVLVEWHSTWYPAEVLRRDGHRNFIRYTGYGKEWDEWVGPERIRGQFGPFLQISHSFASLLLALAGGTLASCLGATPRSARWFWVLWGGSAAALVAVSLLAMASDSELGGGAALTLFLSLLFLAALAAYCGIERGRTFALGFAIVSGGYFLLHFGPGLETAVGPHLLSTRCLNAIRDWLHPSVAIPPQVVWNFGNTSPFSPVRLWYPNGQPAASSCVLAGHALLAGILGLLGGLVAQWLSRRPRTTENGGPALAEASLSNSTTTLK